MDQYRIEDWREIASAQKEKEPMLSLFYLAKHKTLDAGRDETNSMVLIDKEQDILKNNKDKEIKYVLASDYLEGICTFAKAVKNQISEKELEQIKLRQFTQLFSQMQL